MTVDDDGRSARERVLEACDSSVHTVDPAVSHDLHRFGGTREPCALASAFLPSYPYTEMCAKSF